MNIVRFGMEFAKVPEVLIQILKDSEEKNRKLAEGLNRFKAGDKIIVDAGPFVGLEGVFDKYRGDERIIVLLNVLQQAAKIELSLLDVNKAT